MVGPFTPNAGFIVPNTGDLVDTWGDDATNPDYVAIDGMFCGVQTITLGSSPVTLTAETGFTATPGAGPTQSQNRVLRFSGTLTANVTVTLPIPASYLCENLCTGDFTVTLRGSTATEVVCLPPGEIVEVYNDGANVRFVGLGRMGEMEHWAGLTSMPAWVTGCTKRPYLLCGDPATVYNVSDFPYLGARLLGQFGGNGVTTFAAPDMRGRVPLAYDGTGTRITSAGCGINGQTIGASADNQSVTLTAGQLPANIPFSGGWTFSPTASGTYWLGTTTFVAQNGTTNAVPIATQQTTIGGTISSNGFAINSSGGGLHTNVQPSIVTGIWVVKT